MDRINDSTSGEKGSRPSMARSAPSRLLDCACTLDCTLARNEKAITIDATLRITQAMDRNSGLRPRRASRSAMRKTQILSRNVPRFSELGVLCVFAGVIYPLHTWLGLRCPKLFSPLEGL